MLYLVRWPELRASLVSARDESDLLDILDQIDDPGGCVYNVYRGPIWVDFVLPVKIRDITPEKPDATDVTDFTVDPTAEFEAPMSLEALRPEVPPCDWGHIMRESVMRGAFPHLYEWTEANEEDVEAEPYPDDLRKALVADLDPLVKHCQARKALHAREDPAAELMKSMDVTVMPPTWVATANDRPEKTLAASMRRLASTMAEKLGVTPDAVLTTLRSPEVRECVEDVGEDWCLVVDAALEDEDEDEDAA